MSRCAFICFLLLVVCLLEICAQEKAKSFSGQFEETPFVEFAAAVEAQTGTKFYYRASWVDDLPVTLSGQNHSLLNVLDFIFEGTALTYYLDEWNHLFLTESATLLA